MEYGGRSSRICQAGGEGNGVDVTRLEDVIKEVIDIKTLLYSIQCSV